MVDQVQGIKGKETEYTFLRKAGFFLRVAVSGLSFYLRPQTSAASPIFLFPSNCWLRLKSKVRPFPQLERKVLAIFDV